MEQLLESLNHLSEPGNEAAMGILSAIIIVTTVCMMMGLQAIASAKFYHRLPADQAFIRTGFGSARVVIGRGAWAIPPFYTGQSLSLTAIEVKLTDSDLRTESADLPNVFEVAIPSNADMILLASRLISFQSAAEKRQLIEDLILAEIDNFVRTFPDGTAEHFEERVEAAVNTVGHTILACQHL